MTMCINCGELLSNTGEFCQECGTRNIPLNIINEAQSSINTFKDETLIKKPKKIYYEPKKNHKITPEQEKEESQDAMVLLYMGAIVGGIIGTVLGLMFGFIIGMVIGMFFGAIFGMAGGFFLAIIYKSIKHFTR